MKAYYFFIAAFLPLMGFSQLYIGNTGVVYSKDWVVSVSQNVNIQSTGNFYLRGNAQLVQKTTSTSSNQGTGALSVFQEGSSNQYKYNYWCSPVGGNAAATVGNNSFGITQLYRPTGLVTSDPATILAMDNYDGVANPLAIAPYWVWKFLSGTQYSEWIGVHSASTINAGEGFTMKGVSGTDALTVLGVSNNNGSKQRYDYRGKPNDGTISVTVGANKFTLTGNPYPSALDVNAFLLDSGNTAIDGTALYWEQSATPNSHYLADYIGGYGIYIPISMGSTGSYVPATFASYNGNGSVNNPNVGNGSLYERRYAPIGQGFMVNGSANGTVQLKNAHRTFVTEGQSNFSQFERPVSSLPPGPPGVDSFDNFEDGMVDYGDLITPSQIRLNVDLGNNYTRQLLLLLVPESTNGVDRGMEGLNPEVLPTDVSFYLDEKDYVAQSVPFNANQQLPLSIKASEATNLKFSLSEIINFDSNQSIYIYDSLDESYHDIKNSDYTVSINSGNDISRFQLRFVNQTLSAPHDELKNSLNVYQDNKEQKLNVRNQEMIEISSVQLYDISGRLVFDMEQPENLSLFSISTSTYSSGIYLLKMQSVDNREFVKKVAIRN